MVAISSTLTEYTEGVADTTITGPVMMWEDVNDIIRAASADKPFPVEIISGSSSGTEYTEGATDASITGTAALWEDTSDTLRPISATYPLPVNIISGAVAGVQYTEGDADATITGTAILWEAAANALSAVSAAAPMPVDTELPAAAALADNTANPTVPSIGVYLMCWDGTNWDRAPGTTADGLSVKTTNTVTTKEVRAAACSAANVSSSATNVTLLASNANRLGATIANDSTAILYVKYGATATSTSFHVVLAAKDANGVCAYLEIPYAYTGIIDGIWASANGAARVGEVTLV